MIDSSARIDPSAKIADDVVIGPWSIIGPNVEIDEGTEVASHVVIKGPTRIGKNNRIFQFATIGEETPDLKYKGEDTRLIIGDANVIREGVTIHRGTVQDRGETVIGSNNLLMAYVHIAHDSIVGDHTIFANNASLAGHVTVNDWVILGGYTLVHQFCQLGAHSFTGMGTAVGKDIPAYVTVNGSPAQVYGINSEGLRRRNFSSEAIAAIKRAYKVVYRQGLTTEQAIEALQPMIAEFPEVQLLEDSLRNSTRGIVR